MKLLRPEQIPQVILASDRDELEDTSTEAVDQGRGL
jgi:hypothetical protein